MDRNSVVVVCDSYYLSVNTGQSADSSSRSPSPNRSLKGFNLFKVISQKLGRGIRKSKEDKCTSSDEDEDSNSSLNSIPRSKNATSQTPKDEVRCDCEYFYKTQNQRVISEKSMPEKDKLGVKDYRKKCLKFSTPCRHQHSSGSDSYSSSNDDSSESNDTDQKTNTSNFSSNDSSASSSSSSSSSGGSYEQSTVALRKGLKNLHLRSKSLSCFSISQIKDLKQRRDSSSKEQKVKKNPQKILRQPPTHTYVRGISGLPTLRVINSRGCYNNQYSRG